MSKKNNLIATYGTLRLGQSNNGVLKRTNAIYIGEFQSEPEFTMYSVFDSYPALVKDGNTSITIQVFKASDEGLEDVDALEGYYPDSDHYHYNRIKIATPWGPAYLYVYDEHPKDYKVIESGDWVEYHNAKRINYAV